ncbi:SRPBCC domain-containing protein [Flavobacterium wongokense]|uniref:SRPBCC domain-containing protein n=1 Tax=Flavobacterium wongokense TaxID=2910674 RepID=UPI001F2E50DB|nr:SRPBCC domain-containing protein [Flavobacterium sp. WG47]MCF6131836.1 SRPBCC domain-containing protein [Flavobacterium sp. WG47]
MKTDVLEINVAMQISKPINEVFEAIANPEKMCNYFISQSTGRMEEGKNLVWKFPEFDMEVPVKVVKAEQSLISFYWENSGKDLLVEIRLSTVGDNFTLVKISEKSMENNEAGLKWLSGNSFGWSNFLSCLKAYIEFGINLRKGSFDFMKK